MYHPTIPLGDLTPRFPPPPTPDEPFHGFEDVWHEKRAELPFVIGKSTLWIPVDSITLTLFGSHYGEEVIPQGYATVVIDDDAHHVAIMWGTSCSPSDHAIYGRDAFLALAVRDYCERHFEFWQNWAKGRL